MPADARWSDKDGFSKGWFWKGGLGKGWFTRLASGASRFTGSPLCFGIAVLLVLTWAVTGPVFKYSNTWQLVINTGTTIVTFLMVFLIQSGQNRDSKALQLKLDELIRVTRQARDELLDVEDLDEEDLQRLQACYGELAREARGKPAMAERAIDLHERAIAELRANQAS